MPRELSGRCTISFTSAGVVRFSRHRQAAIAFLEWLTTEQAQRLFADANEEFPVNPTVSPSKEVQSWGSFKKDDINLEVAGRLQRQATMLMDRADYR